VSKYVPYPLGGGFYISFFKTISIGYDDILKKNKLSWGHQKDYSEQSSKSAKNANKACHISGKNHEFINNSPKVN
jgi:hypothetical protein